MKNTFVKKALPHVAAILIFLVVALFFCRPALEGNVLNQHDVLGWKGMAQNAFDYKEKTGHFPLWNSNVFSGMPNYQIAVEGDSPLPNLQKIFTFGLPDPVHQFFIASICFYILCLVLGLSPLVGIMGGLAYAFTTYNPVILSAGHMTKIMAIAYTPLLLAGLLLIYTKRYWLGLAVTTLGGFLQINANHPQISYYAFITIGFISLGYLAYWIKNKEWKHILTTAGVTLASLTAIVLACCFSFMLGSEYAKATIRGGKSIEINGENVKQEKTQGLDTSYAFQYSFSIAEPLVAIMPNAFGGSSSSTLSEDSKVVSKLSEKGIPETNAAQLAGSLPRYWGGLESTAGPAYIGAIICLLALIGFVLLKYPLRWGLLAASILGILMAWGKFFPGFNVFLFENLPAYNKFRAPSMAMVILQITLPIVAVLTLQQLFYQPDSRDFVKANLKKILYAMGGLTALLVLIYLTQSYASSIDNQILANNWDNSGTDTIGRTIVSGMKADRASMFGGQIMRTLGFMLLLLGTIWLFMRNQLKAATATSLLAVILLADLLIVGGKYLNEENYESKEEQLAQNFTKTAIDNEILKDTSLSYRVYNAGPERFSASDYRVSPFHKAIGGYHPAKLRVYQDIIERYLYAGIGNQEILNMLNTKYIIAQNPQNGQQMLLPNAEANGPVWLVKHVKAVADDVAEIQAIGNINLKDTAIVQSSFFQNGVQPQYDSAASIRLSKFDNDTMDYVYSSTSPQFAVFSEVYYPMGWNAYIDGKKAEYVKTNYALRGMSLPAGQHAIRFIFEPELYKKAARLSYIGAWLIILLVLGGFGMHWWTSRKKGIAKSQL